MSPETHAWFRGRLAAQAAGLLNEVEERRFLEHRALCETCRKAFDEFTTSDEAALTERGAHIPAAMLARWPAARRELKGLERTMVREHLRHCAECRGDLERVGHTPDLEYAPGLEREPRPLDWRARLFGRVPRSGAARDAEAPASRSAPAGTIPRRSWAPWALAGWATVATAAAIILAVIPRGPSTEGVTPAVSPSVTAPPTPAPPPIGPYSLEPAPPIVHLRTELRGAPRRMPAVVLDSSARAVQLVVGPLDLPEGGPIEAEVLAAGIVVLHRAVPRPASGGISLFLDRADSRLEPGDYRLRLFARPASAAQALGPDTVEFVFRIVRPAR